MITTFELLSKQVKENIHHLHECALMGDEDARRLLEDLGIYMREHTGEVATGKNVMKKKDDVLLDCPAASLNNQTSPKVPELNYFAPHKRLQVMLSGEWFSRVCTRTDIYDKVWTDQLIDDLFEEYGEYIAKEWAINTTGKKNRHVMIRGNVLGVLSDNKVISSNCLHVARAYLGISKDDKDVENRKKVSTFANYMGKGFKQPYAFWMTNYIRRTQKENR